MKMLMRVPFRRREMLLAPLLLLFLSLLGVANPARADSGVTVTFTQTGGWSGGFGASIDIANNTTQPIDGWKLVFDFSSQIDALWNGDWTKAGSTYTVTPLSWNGTIAPGAKVNLGLNGTGEFTPSTPSKATLNGVDVTLKTVVGTVGPGPSVAAIQIVGADGDLVALQITVPQGVTKFPLKLASGDAGTFQVTSNNETVVKASVDATGNLVLNGVGAGRAGLRLEEPASKSTRFVGIRVKAADGALPGLPNYLALASVSEDSDDHLNFWHDFTPGAKNKRMDARYIYLNGGPGQDGWFNWVPNGGRATRYIRESRMMGMIPFFVYYNIPGGNESYFTDKGDMQDAAYMKSYYTILKKTLDIINAESPDDMVGMVFEPDLLGYMAQSEKDANGKVASPSTIMAMVHSAYDSGVLVKGADPDFPDTLKGMVQSINYIVSKVSPQVYFGWQMNLWASPAGGWTTPVPGNGLMHLTDTKGVAAGRPLIYNEAKAITQYYLDAGVTSNGAKFMSVDKYGLDATGAEASAAANPAGSLWFWNNDQWNNYLTLVRAMHDTSQLPIILWQLTVGHVNHSTATDPYDPSGAFPDLTNVDRKMEDSAGSYFFGDTFTTDGARLEHFAKNDGADPKVKVTGNSVTWGEHMTDAAAAGAVMAMFGAGTGSSTTNVGATPTDSFWWITEAEEYFAHPIPLTPPAALKGDVNADGSVDVTDATLALQIIVGLALPTDAQNLAADMSGDGHVDVADAILILRKVAGLDP